MQLPILKNIIRIAMVAANLGMISCASHPAARESNRAPDEAEPAVKAVKLADAGAAVVNDPIPAIPDKSDQLVHINVIKDIMPLGTVMNNNAFWKMIDENIVDQRTHDILWKNGLRAGVGKVADWPQYRKTLEHENAVLENTGISAPPEFKGIPLRMLPSLPEEDIWVFNEDGLSGRTYFNCTNCFMFSFQWAPRKENTIRMAICPAVLTTRADYSLAAFPPPDELLREENIYDLRLHVDLGPDDFLVLAPSAEVSHDFDRIGSHLLVTNAGADRYEKVLIITPIILPLRQTGLPSPTTKPAPAKRPP